MKEQEIADSLMRVYPSMDKLTKAEDRYSTFDYSNDKYLLEFKSRESKFDPWIIEQLKLDANQAIALDECKSFIFVIECKRIIYVWNISKMVDNQFDFRFHRKQLPNYTDLDDRDEQYKIFKMTGFIPVSSCTKILYV